jgi:hypothetical protein
VIRVFGARTVRWRSVFAVHTWIVVKEKGAPGYSRYDYTAWGEPIRTNGFSPDGRWFGAMPETIVAVDGERAEAIIPKIRYVIENYKFRSYGYYNPWPGPTPIPSYRPRWIPFPDCGPFCRPPRSARTFPTTGAGSASRRRARASASLAGYLGLTVGWVEGFEFNFFGAVLGFDIRRPAIKLPGLGRLGVTAGL